MLGKKLGLSSIELSFGQILKETQILINIGKLTGTTGFRNIIYMCLQMVKYNEVMVPKKPFVFISKSYRKLGQVSLRNHLSNINGIMLPKSGRLSIYVLFGTY